MVLYNGAWPARDRLLVMPDGYGIELSQLIHAAMILRTQVVHNRLEGVLGFRPRNGKLPCPIAVRLGVSAPAADV